MAVADGGYDGRCQCGRLQGAAGFCTADAAASSHGGVFGNGRSLVRGASGEEVGDAGGHLLYEDPVLFVPLLGAALPGGGALIGVLEACVLGLLERGDFYQ